MLKCAPHAATTCYSRALTHMHSRAHTCTRKKAPYPFASSLASADMHSSSSTAAAAPGSGFKSGSMGGSSMNAAKLAESRHDPPFRRAAKMKHSLRLRGLVGCDGHEVDPPLLLAAYKEAATGLLGVSSTVHG